MWKFNWGVFWAIEIAIVPFAVIGAVVGYKIHNLLISIDSTLAKMYSAITRSSILGI